VALTNLVALTTLANAKDELGITDSTQDDRLERYILQASSAIEGYCDRAFRKTSQVETLQASGTRRIVLARTPLASLTSIVVDETTVDADEYEIEDASAGIVYRERGWPRRDAVVPWSISHDAIAGTAKRDVVVTYTGGYVLPNDSTGTRDLPFDVEAACLLTVVSIYRGRGRDRAVSSKGTGDASVSYRLPNTIIGVGMGGVIPDEATVMLAKYRRVPMVSV
jgi:hypothetical protein